MRLLNLGAFGVIVTLSLLLAGGNTVFSQVWWQETGQKYDYDLSGHRFLIVLGEDFDFHETMIIKEHWEGWGAKVDIAGTDEKLTGHCWKKTKTGWDRSEQKQIKTNLLLSEVKLSTYDVLFFPGGNSPKSLLQKDSSGVVRMIQEADRKGLTLAGICHGPQALAAAGIVRGQKVTGHREVMRQIEEAGGEYVNEVCVVDGNLVTGNWPYFETMAVKVAEKVLYPEGGGPSEKSPFQTNPILKAIKERRSIRKFQDREVEPHKIEQILRAGTWAPSANNEQPWKFVVVRNQKTKERVIEALEARMKDYYQAHGIPLDHMKAYWSNIFAAPVHIFAFCDTSGLEIEKEWEEIQTLWITQGVCLACQNVLLAAKALGLGSLWIGLTLCVEDEIKKLLEVPAHARLMTVIAIGYAAKQPLPRLRKPLCEVRFFEKWKSD